MRTRSLLVPLVLSIATACASSPESASAEAVLARPRSGFVPVEGGRVHYEVHGDGARTPLLVPHGGPGIPHDDLANLALLGDERPVVFYDQLGCGLSDRPEDLTLWTRERFVRELAAVRRALGLDEIVLYGHSWGSILAVDALSGHGGAPAEGVRGAVLAGPALSIPRWTEDSRRLIATLPAEHAAAILEGERTGRTDTEAFHAATEVFYRRCVCRSDPWPPELDAAFAGMAVPVYTTMNGPTEFGEFDEATPETTRAYAALVPDAELAVIEGAAHVANYDRPQEYMRELRSWMDRRGL